MSPALPVSAEFVLTAVVTLALVKLIVMVVSILLPPRFIREWKCDRVGGEGY